MIIYYHNIPKAFSPLCIMRKKSLFKYTRIGKKGLRTDLETIRDFQDRGIDCLIKGDWLWTDLRGWLASRRVHLRRAECPVYRLIGESPEVKVKIRTNLHGQNVCLTTNLGHIITHFPGEIVIYVTDSHKDTLMGTLETLLS